MHVLLRARHGELGTGLLGELHLVDDADAPRRAHRVELPATSRCLVRDAHPIVEAEGSNAKVALRSRTPVDDELVVVIDGRTLDLRVLAAFDQGNEPGVNVAAPDAADEVPTFEERHRAFEHRARVDEIELGEPVVAAVVARLAKVRLDDASERAAVLHAEVARIEIDLVEELGRNHARQTPKMIDVRDPHAVDEHRRRLIAVTAHDELPRERRRARDTRQVLNGPQGVAGGARNARELAAGQRVARHLAARSLAAHDHLVARFARRDEAIAHVRPFGR